MAIFNLSIKLSFVRSRKMVLLGSLLGITSLTIAGTLLFLYQFRNSIYPNISIENIPVGGLTKDQALQKILSQESELPAQTLELAVDNITLASESAQLGANYDTQSAIDTAYNFGRTKTLDKRLLTLAKLLTKKENIPVTVRYDLDALQLMTEKLKERVDIEGAAPEAQLAYSGSPASLTIEPGKDGRELAVEPTLQKILETLQETSPETTRIHISALVASTSAKLDTDAITQAQQRATKYLDKNVSFSPQSENNSELRQTLNDQEMISLLAFPEGYSQEKIEILLTTWEEKISRPPQDAEFEYNPETWVVTKFVPDHDGLTLDTEKTQQQLETLLHDIEEEKELPEQLPLELISQPPLVTLAETNNLGINEKIGFGDSYYSHSIPGRIHNVALTTKKINLTLVPPGQEFSFN
ncbi:peptidoglycan binding domain-containing protein, partial [Candidatus Woesebacteria bacterium]|nr:peptidoglycan binding domain-containing protein [Candidatus Woesebacteria bacterium]